MDPSQNLYTAGQVFGAGLMVHGVLKASGAVRQLKGSALKLVQTLESFPDR